MIQSPRDLAVETGRAGWLPRLVGGPWCEAALAAALAYCFFFVGTGDIPILGRDEGRFAQAAREMLDRGELVVPTFAGAPRYHKPILVYWCTMASYSAFGVNPRAARLPANAAGALTVLLVAWWARRRLPPGSGLVAGSMLAATLVFHVQARACTADMVMLLPTVAAMLALERIFGGDGRRRWPLMLWLGMALSVLAKGPVGPAVAATTGLALWALGRRWRPWEVWAAVTLLFLGWWRAGPLVLAVPLAAALVAVVRDTAAVRATARLRWSWGLPLAAAVVAPWVVAAWRATGGELLRVGLGHHVIARSLTPFESHGGFPGFYVVTAVVVAFPWFGVLPQAVRELRRRWAGDAAFRFRVAWLLGPLVALELVQTRLVHYWLPSYPAGVLLVVCWLFGPAGHRPRLAADARVLTVLGGLAAAVLPIAVGWRLHIADLVGVAGVVVAPLLGCVLWAAVGGRDARRSAVTVVVGAVLYLGLLMVVFLPTLADDLLPVRAAAMIRAQRNTGEPVLVYRLRDDELLFALPADVVVCRTSGDLASRLDGGEGPFLGVARATDLERFVREMGVVAPAEVARIRGVELGRVRWQEVVLFRPVAGGGR